MIDIICTVTYMHMHIYVCMYCALADACMAITGSKQHNVCEQFLYHWMKVLSVVVVVVVVVGHKQWYGVYAECTCGGM